MNNDMRIICTTIGGPGPGDYGSQMVPYIFTGEPPDWLKLVKKAAATREIEATQEIEAIRPLPPAHLSALEVCEDLNLNCTSNYDKHLARVKVYVRDLDFCRQCSDE